MQRNQSTQGALVTALTAARRGEWWITQDELARAVRIEACAGRNAYNLDLLWQASKRKDLSVITALETEVK